MFKFKGSKSAIGLAALSLLVVFTPTASAGKPIPTLNGAICKAWGGTWDSGKLTYCTVGPNAFLATLDSIVIKEKTTLILDKNVDLVGFMQNSGTVFNRAILRNFGTISNEGALSVVFNSGTITNNGNFFLYGDGVNAGTTLQNVGTFENYGTFSHRAAGYNFTNSGVIYNYGFFATCINNNLGGILEGVYAC